MLLQICISLSLESCMQFSVFLPSESWAGCSVSCSYPAKRKSPVLCHTSRANAMLSRIYNRASLCMRLRPVVAGEPQLNETTIPMVRRERRLQRRQYLGYLQTAVSTACLKADHMCAKICDSMLLTSTLKQAETQQAASALKDDRSPCKPRRCNRL